MALAVLIFGGGLTFFSWDLAAEPRFVDEAAFLSQSYYWDLAATGRWNDPLWLEYPAYDLPPLPKYLIGASLQAHGLPRPGRSWAIAWYRNTSEARFATPAALQAARLPSLLFGGLGCVAIFAIGTIGSDRRVGLLSAFLLLMNPLYRLHARRAMADVPAEALILCTLAVALASWKVDLSGRTTPRRTLAASFLVGLLGGLAVLAKLNGGLGLMTVWAWAGLGVILTCLRPIAKQVSSSALALVGGSILAAVCALITFIALNPSVTARPTAPNAIPPFAPLPSNQNIIERLRKVVEHRIEVSRSGQTSFPDDALDSVRAKATALIVQGFGRFGPFGPSHADSTRRYDWDQDRGVILWLPLVLAGLVLALLRGERQRREGEVPVSWALALQFLVAMVTVGAFLPLAWDRYFPPIQACSALLAAVAIVSLFDLIRSKAAHS